MLKIIFTLDYEIHGNGEGCPRTLMLNPTSRLLRLFEDYGAKLTIMADVAEILKFKEYQEKVGRDDYSYNKIVKQLRSAISRGHDVQLHIHSSYFRSYHKQGRWSQDWSEYNFASLPYERMVGMVKKGKDFLESILKPIKSTYRCVAFRAANWSVVPSNNVAKALLENDIFIDTSIFKGGQRNGHVSFDYINAYHHLRPWPAKFTDFCQYDPKSRLWEYPIYTEQRNILAFLSLNRIYRAVLGKLYRMPKIQTSNMDCRKHRKKYIPNMKSFFTKHAWKADFNQCTGRQLIRALVRAERNTTISEIVPFILIGHSKLFNFWNNTSLRPFLSFVSKQKERFTFDTFSHFSQ